MEPVSSYKFSGDILVLVILMIWGRSNFLNIFKYWKLSPKMQSPEFMAVNRMDTFPLLPMFTRLPLQFPGPIPFSHIFTLPPPVHASYWASQTSVCILFPWAFLKKADADSVDLGQT